EEADHETDHVARSVEITALLARRLGEHVDEKLVGCAEQIGELKVFVAQAIAAEMANQILAGVIRHDALVALSAQKLDVVEHMLQGFVGLAERAKSLVENAAVGFGGVVELHLQVTPAGALRNEEAIVEIRILAVLLFGLLEWHAL